MASKLQLITALYTETIHSISQNPERWKQFLRAAARNYKLPFDEQLLIYAQRPEATAVLEIERWNERFRRWVNRGSTGIAVFDRTSDRPRLKYYFDIADTHETLPASPVPLWEVRPEFVPDVVEHLENSFGELGDTETFASALLSVADNLAADNLPDYYDQLAGLGVEMDEATYFLALKNSVACMLLSRCGVEPVGTNFDTLAWFNTPAAVNALGGAVSAIAEMGLREIAATVLALQKNIIRTFDGPPAPVYNEEKKENDHEPDLHERERVQHPRSGPAPAAGGQFDPLGPGAAEPPAQPQASSAYAHDDAGQPVAPPAGGAGHSRSAARPADAADGGGPGRDGGTQGQRSDGLGGPDEQYPGQRGGTGDAGASEQLSLFFPTQAEQIEQIEEAAVERTAVFSVPMEELDRELARGSGSEGGKFRIYRHFVHAHTPDENLNFLRNEFGTGGHSPMGGSAYWVNHGNAGLVFYVNFSDKHYRIAWKQVAQRIHDLISIDRYLTPAEKEEYESRYLEPREDDPADILSPAPELLPAEPYVVIDWSESTRFHESERLTFTEADAKFKAVELIERRERAEQGKTGGYNKTSGKVYYLDAPEDTELSSYEFRYDICDYDELHSGLYNHISNFWSNAEKRMLAGEYTGVTQEDIVEVRRLLATLEPLQSKDSPRVVYRRYLPRLVEDIQHSDIFIDLTDRNLEAIEAEVMVVEWLDGAAARTETYPDLREALGLPMLREWLVEDLLERTYQDVILDIRTHLERNERNPDAPAWAAHPMGFTDDAAVPEQPVEPADGTHADLPNTTPAPTRVMPRPPETGGVFYPGEIELVQHHIPRYTVRRISFVDVISSNPRRADIADKDHAYGVWDGEAGRYLKNDDETYVVFDTYREAEAYADQQNEAKRQNYRITDDALGHGGAKTKYRANIEAITLLKALDAENRLATPAEQEILSRYVGWGSLSQAFEENRDGWSEEFQELQALLTPEEYAAARASTLNAHYTSPTVIKAIYKAVENMGFTQGNVLEPSCGIGNFFGLVPDSMAESKLYGVELDPITGRIARQLYQTANIAIQGFEATELPDSFFDLAIGNVPFGSYSLVERRYDKHKFLIHDHFFAKTLDKVRPGGVVAFITSKGTLDKQNPAVRRYIAQRAELLGAIRLPSNAFLRNAGTEVTTDIIFLQKRDRVIDVEPDWVHLGQTDDEIPVNAYFAEHPDMILGTMARDDMMYGNANETTCQPYPDRDLADLLDEAIQNIQAEIVDYEKETQQEQDESIPADPSVRNFSYTMYNGKAYFRENSRMMPQELSATARSRAVGMIGIRDSARKLIDLQVEDAPDDIIQREQARLNTLYDTYTKKYGLLSDRANATVFRDDSSYCLLCSLEVIDEDGKLERKADMFTKRTIRPNAPVTHVNTAAEALAVSIAEKARVDLDFMTELSGLDRDRLLADLEGVVFLNIGSAESQDKAYVTADEYLSGNVREKLALAREAQQTFPDGRYESNVGALEAAQPKNLTAAEISVRLGATWIPVEDIQQFVFELMGTPRWMRDHIKVSYTPLTAEWGIDGSRMDRDSVKATSTYGTRRKNAYDIIEASLNLRDARVYDRVDGPDGKPKSVLNKKETTIAQAKQEAIKQAFQDWIWSDPDRRARLVQSYNERFNSTRLREYDGRHINFVGMNPEISLRAHQVNAVARILYGGNTLLAHEVGAGKTYEMVAAAMESKRLGLCHKSMIVVPNHIIEQFAAEWLQLYPSANILVSTKKDFEMHNRHKFCGRIATGDYDAVIIGHSQFEKIPMSTEFQVRVLEDQLDEILLGIEEAKEEQGERFTIKQLEKTRKSIEARLERLNDQSRKDNVVTFEQLGVDRIFVDEAHGYKNLFLFTKMRNVAGIAQTEAQKSSDLFMKCRYLDEQTGGRGVVFATGTPISNSMVELYSIQRYLQYDNLTRHGLHHFDAWASTFGETVTAIELSPEGTGYRAKTRFAKFYNLPELMTMFRETADIQTADMLNLPVPKANFHVVKVPSSDLQTEMVQGLAERAEQVRAKAVDPQTDNMLKITNDGRKLALDQRLMNPMLPDFEDSKVNACVGNVYDIWERTAERRSAQLVFCDLSTPKGDGSFNVYDDIKAKLIARGVPEAEIAFIHDAKTETQKKELFAKVRAGTVRVLIGSTFKMGSGTNVQDRLIALHDLDVPWRPSDVGQAKRTAYAQRKAACM